MQRREPGRGSPPGDRAAGCFVGAARCPGAAPRRTGDAVRLKAPSSCEFLAVVVGLGLALGERESPRVPEPPKARPSDVPGRWGRGGEGRPGASSAPGTPDPGSAAAGKPAGCLSPAPCPAGRCPLPRRLPGSCPGPCLSSWHLHKHPHSSRPRACVRARVSPGLTHVGTGEHPAPPPPGWEPPPGPSRPVLPAPASETGPHGFSRI